MRAIEILWAGLFRLFCGATLVFLVLPLLVVAPLAFNDSDFLTYPMRGFSLRWIEEILLSDQWLPPIRNSLFISTCAALIATMLGTAAALGLSKTRTFWRAPQMGLFLMPVVMPIAVLAVGTYLAFVRWGLQGTFAGLILVHAGLGVPFVVTTVAATLKGYDERLFRAALSLGAPPLTAFRQVTLPLILPGVLAGTVFAFSVSFDEVITSLFLAGPSQRTLPLQMFSGMRENVSPAIAAAALFMMVTAVLLLLTVEWLRRRAARRQGG